MLSLFILLLDALVTFLLTLLNLSKQMQTTFLLSQLLMLLSKFFLHFFLFLPFVLLKFQLNVSLFLLSLQFLNPFLCKVVRTYLALIQFSHTLITLKCISIITFSALLITLISACLSLFTLTASNRMKLPRLLLSLSH